MIRVFVTITLLLFVLPSFAQSTAAPVQAEQVLFLGPLPAFASDSLHQSGKAKEQRQQLLRLLERQPVPVAGRTVELFGQRLQWRQLTPTEAAAAGPGVWFAQLQQDAFFKGRLEVTGVKAAQLYLNFQAKNGSSTELALATGWQQLLIFTDGRKDDDEVLLQVTSSNEVPAAFRLAAKEPVNNRLLTNAETITQLALSPDTNWMLLSFSGRSDVSDTQLQRTELRDVSRNQVQRSWSGQVLSRAAFSPDNQWLSYMANNTLWLMNLNTGELRSLLENQTGLGSYRWAPDSNSIVLQWTEADTSLQQSKAKMYRALEDRWRGHRDISRLFQLDIASGLVRVLTTDRRSSVLSDIRPDGNALLYTQRVNDRTTPPHASSALFELDLTTLQSREIGTFAHLNQVLYHRDQLLVVAGPNFAGGAGVNLPSDDYIANDYDGQLYLMDKNGEHIQPLSKDFHPAISSVAVNARGQVIAQVSEGDRSALYSVDTNRQRFQKLALSLDVIERFELANDRGATVLAVGSGVATPQQLELIRPGQRRSTVLHSSAALYQHIQLGEVRDFHVENPQGDRIEGRYYLPPDFDASKKYPTIVYYYGGTTTVNRQFTGRYPFHHWAANGYIVYVVQPRGTIGYGQRFSALHVNAWGKYTADDIIYATERFVAEHDFVDGKRLGNIGASYGGFMTMYLATQTDLFAASTSHAGISALSSYWGQGWWGFLYSGIASRDSFPWNNHELYVGQSPLYMADKINTPLLLITGDSDVNVPAGESQQMFTALKLLGREVALVEIPGEDHHIIDREKRYVWWDHLLAWFDKHLKDQPDWWQHLSH
ncbi:S9 family peptidase [Alkalimonas amylolytica]|uniref:Dipeptidyl peptidase IV (DPP IV) N-terminal region n=1 Tax=Alkalimonas amylolytica TaxID=152573 RepID=A0A1H4A603_ALKAM|nr:prolyl oligopeptidase family serine peptidase [Alkalimonas amylolytica]SEA31439.1 Dipeptidyl peptidase IV (DPP IV) N-terminal region [Alkalimonas amylolytica]